MHESIHVLLVEDNDGDADLIAELLSENLGGVSFLIQHVDRFSAALQLISDARFDVILLDLTLPDSSGVDTLKQLRSQCGDIPVIVITGYLDREMGVEALNAGAQDYFVKGNVDAQLLMKAVLRQVRRRQRLLQEGRGPDRTDPQ